MGLSASMWTSVSGLLMHGEKMNVIGNNIANVNTLGFKSQRMDFQDFIYQDGFSTNGPTQIGRGVKIGAVLGDFSQASFETTNTATDLAIAGRGFFQVRDNNSNQTWYTRAGDFRFDKEGYLRDPNGHALQGWKIPQASGTSESSGSIAVGSSSSVIRGAGSPTDVCLDTWSVPPKATTKVTYSLNLTSAAGNDKSTSMNNPCFSLFDVWDGTKEPPIAENAYAYPASLTVYDESGTKHTVTMYCDQVTAKVTDNSVTPAVDKTLGLPAGYSMYEYIITTDPSTDLRTYGGVAYDTKTGTYDDPGTLHNFSDNKAAGILMMGTMIFNSAGQMVDMTAYSYDAVGDYKKGTDGKIPQPGEQKDPKDLQYWQPTRISSNGLPLLSANFGGLGGASTVGSAGAAGKNIEIDFGMKNVAGGEYAAYWKNGDAAASTVGGYVTLDKANEGPYSKLGTAERAQRLTDATTSYGEASSSKKTIQDGYSYGNLSNYNVDASGILYGIYSNGVSLPLYQIALYDFVNKEGLRREGGNLFSATLASGEPQIGPAGEGGLGNIEGFSVEQSNVDMAREFVQMITTQRGFQANSKTVTTVDSMLEVVINMKR